MKYLVIPIGSLSDKSVEAIIAAAMKAEDNRGLRVVLDLQTVWFQAAQIPAPIIRP